MPQSQTVVLIDHHGAQIQHLDDAAVESVREHRHYTRQHASDVRSEHEFFRDVCDALAARAEILVLGSHTAQADFRRYVDKHRPALAEHLVGWETVDQPTPAQALAAARAFFVKFDRMAGRSHSQ
jgi:stalled ribosome rescue protein Dom34